MNRIKVLFDCPSPGLRGGPPTHLPLLENELRRYTEIESFDYGRRTDSESTFDKLLGRASDLIDLRAKIAEFRPDVIHHNTAFDARAIVRDAALLWVAGHYRIPVFLKMHGSLDEMFGTVKPALKRLRDAVIRNAACIGVLSPREKAKYLSAWPSLGSRVKVVKNIIKPEFYAVERRESERPTVLFISRFIRQKGVFDLLAAVPGVLEKFPAAQFVFIGSGGDAGEFDAQVTDLRLALSVKRIDHLDNQATVAYYSSAWTFAFPTRFPEGMPMVVAEAMAAGVPIVTTPTNFSRSYMESGEHCLFVDVGNASSMAQRIVELLGSTELRRRMSVNNRALAQDFRAPAVAGEFLDIYRELRRR